MLIRNIVHLFIALAVCPQATVYGGLMKELQRKFMLIRQSVPLHVKEGLFYDTCNLCKFGPCTPIIQPSVDDKDFDLSLTDAKKLYSIVDSLPSSWLPDAKRKIVTDILINSSAMKRTTTAKLFKPRYEMSIGAPIYFTFSKGMWDYIFLTALSLPMPEFFARHFEYEIKLQQNENADKDQKDQSRFAIIEMLMTLPKCLIDEIEKCYNSIQGQNFFTDLNRALTIGGISPQNCGFLMKQPDQENKIKGNSSWFKALLDAYKLKSAIESHDEATINRRISELITEETNYQIIETLTVYGNLRHGRKGFQSLFHDIDTYIANEVYRISVKLLLNKTLYFAQTLENIFKSGATGNKYEIRFLYLIRGRYDIDLKDIINTYNKETMNRFKVDFTAWSASAEHLSYFPEVMLEILEKM